MKTKKRWEPYKRTRNKAQPKPKMIKNLIHIIMQLRKSSVQLFLLYPF